MRLWPTPRPIEAPEGPDPDLLELGNLDSDTVAVAADRAQKLFDDQQERLSGLDQKATQLAGFAGVVLAVLGSAAKDVVDADFSCAMTVLVRGSLLLSALLITVTIVYLVVTVLYPQPFAAVAAEEIRRYLGEGDEPLLEVTPTAFLVRQLRGLYRATASVQQGADEKARQIKAAARLFSAAIALATASIALTLVSG
jgi:hypothetical protein